MTDRLVVIVGGGSVACRKAQGLLAAGATRVRCVALRFDDRMPELVERVAEAFEARHLDGASLVFAATDSPQVNEAVVREARQRGVFVSRADADEQEPGDFATPALWRSDAVLIAVSAAGSPALAAAIRDDLGRKIDARHLQMATVLRELRPIIRRSSLDAAQRRELLQSLAGSDAMAALAEGGMDGLKAWVLRKYPAIGRV